MTYSYDPENRLVKVQYTPGPGTTATVAEYRYDALGRRIEFINSPPQGTTTTTRYCYDGQNVIQEYNYSASGGMSLARAYMHGTQYIDERAVMRSYEPGTSSAADHYYLLEELYSVAGLAASNGLMEEAYVYDTYGQASIWAWPKADVNLDGVVDPSDYIYVRAYLSTAGCPLADANDDGLVDTSDYTSIRTRIGKTKTLVTHSGLDNPFMFTGRITDTLHAANPNAPEDISVAGDPNGFRRIQDNRNRSYDPHHGRWFQRDPLGVRPDAPRGDVHLGNQSKDRADLYEYVSSEPTVRVDERGLWGSDIHERETFNRLHSIGMSEKCARKIAAADNGLDKDPDTKPWGHNQYHFNSWYDRNTRTRVLYEHGRDYWSKKWYATGMARLKQAGQADCTKLDQGLDYIGKSLHGIQDALAHNSSHQAETEFDHIPSVYCARWLDPSGTLIEDCIDARENNPNWWNPNRPDEWSTWVGDANTAINAAGIVGEDLLRIPIVACHCNKWP